MGMKFVGGPRDGQDVPGWAHGLSELYVECDAMQRPADGRWDHPRVRYAKHTLHHPDGHQATFMASLDTMPLHEVESAARAMYPVGA